MDILVIATDWAKSLGKKSVPEPLLRGGKISKGYVLALREEGHRVAVTCSYHHALDELCSNLFHFDLIIVNYEEVDHCGLQESAVGGMLVAAVTSFKYVQFFIQMDQRQLSQDRKPTRFIALVPSVSRIVRKVFKEAGFEVFVAPRNFTEFKRKLRMHVKNGAKQAEAA
jgi:hypothetical protein